LLQKAQKFRAYAYCDEYTLGFEQLTVTPRGKPSDYVYTETEILTWSELSEEVKRLSKQIGEPIIESGEGNNSAQLSNVMAKAVSHNSIALGYKSQAGCLGFRIIGCKADVDGVTSLTTDQILNDGYYDIECSKSINEIKSKLIGKNPSIYLKTNVDNCGIVTAIT
jgi:hypothetical protein